MIGPLVQAAGAWTAKGRLIACYAGGVLVGSLTTGVLLGECGLLFVPVKVSATVFVAAGCAGLFLSLCDFGLGGLRTPTLFRQTNPTWWRRLGPTRALFLWGVDIGLGFSTIRVASLYWFVAIVTVLLQSPFVGLIAFACYGSGLVVNLCIGAFFFERSARGLHCNIAALRLFAPARLILASALALWSLQLFSLALGWSAV